MFVPMLLSLGCPWFDEADRAGVVDVDGDGVLAEAFGGNDCDPNDPAVGGPNVKVFADVDGDGFGDADVPAVKCDVGGGFVADNTDCDDTDASIGGPTSAWPDGDGDGYAPDDATAVTSCPAEHLVPRLGDCNDESPAVHPGAVENCTGGEDTNCDGSVGGDACTTAGLGPWMTNTVDGAGSQTDFAYTVLGRVDVDGDGTLDVVVSAPYGYELFAFSGVDLLAGADLDTTDALLRFDEFQFLMGKGLAIGDATGDGVADLLVGCPGVDDEAEGTGAEVVVVALPADGHVSQNDGSVVADTPTGWFGYSLAWNEDVGGAPALLVGAPVENEFDGAAWVVEMPLPDDEAHAVSALNHGSTSGFPSQGDGYGMGWDVAWLQGSGGDIAVVSDQAGVYGSEISGVVTLWHPEFGTTTPIAEGEGAGIHGINSYEGFGYSLAVGDYSGDGVEDLAVGSIHADGQGPGTGVVFVYNSAAALEGWHDERDADTIFLGEDRNGPRTSPLLGVRVAFAGDMNNDGQQDLAMAAPFAAGLDGEVGAGAVYVAPGGLPDDEYAVQEVAWTRYGHIAELHAGFGLAPAGDIDNDGLDDLVIGMPGWTDDVGTPVGAVTLWWGSQL
ncbi:hypothetical protein LBMAG42_29810 [Deltaproteobacteria bacterium]|nr:hypothetical protein LBMAG42_29810 [Deltaproteobacteria bacterium]